MNKEKDENSSENIIDKLSLNLEAILFYRGVETSFEYMQKITKESTKNILDALSLLEEKLSKSALVLIKNEDKFLLTVNSENSKIIKEIKGEEEYGELSKSALETLSIVLYRSPIGRLDIDSIRGVNSSYSLRSLMIRGMVEKVKKNGETMYIPTVDTFSHLGVSSKENLPDYDKVQKDIDSIESENQEKEKTIFEK